MLLAKIASDADWSDVFFLISLIVLALAAVLHLSGPRMNANPTYAYGDILTVIGLAFLAAGLLFL